MDETKDPNKTTHERIKYRTLYRLQDNFKMGYTVDSAINKLLDYWEDGHKTEG